MNLSNIDLNLLVALDVLLQERSVSRAAERLRIGQPAMSATLGRLRALFNDQLLVRAGRSLEATPFAESLAEPVSDILHRIDSLVNVVHRFDPAVDHRTFSVIASDYITLVLLKPLLTRLASTAPNVRIQTHLLEPDFLTQLGRGSVDALVVPQQGLSDLHAFHVEPLFSDRFVIVTDRDNTSIGEEITAEEFSELPYLRCNSGVMSSFADLHLDRLGIKRNVEMLATSFVMARFMLPGTPMITVVQEKLARILLPESQFRIVHSPIPLPAIDEVLVPAPKRYADAGQIWLHDQIRAVAATL